MLAEAVKRDVEALARNGPSKPLVLRITSNLDAIASLVRHRYSVLPNKPFEGCMASDIFFFLLIIGSNPTGIGFIVNPDRLKSLGLLYGNKELQEVWMLSLIPLYTSRLDQDYWRLVASLLDRKGKPAYSLYFSVVDAKYAPRSLAEKAVSVLANTSMPYNPYRVLYALLVYRYQNRLLEEAALFSTARALYSDAVKPLTKLYRHLYLGRYRVVTSSLEEQRFLEVKRYSLRAVAELFSPILTPAPGGIEGSARLLPYTYLFIVACSLARRGIGGGITLASNNTIGELLRIGQPIISDLAVSLELYMAENGGSIGVDPLALSFSSLCKNTAIDTAELMDNPQLKQLLLQILPSKAPSTETIMGIAAYTALIEAHEQHRLVNLLRLTAIYPLILVDPETAETSIEGASVWGEDPLWLLGSMAWVDKNRQVFIAVGVDLASFYRDTGSRLNRVLLELYNKTWSKYGEYVSIPLTKGDLEALGNATGVNTTRDSLKLFWSIVEGDRRPVSLVDAGWLARAASIRSLNGKPVLVVPLARLAASILLTDIGLRDVAKAALGLADTTSLNTTERWAAAILPAIAPPWENRARMKEERITSNTTRIPVSEEKLAREAENLLNRTHDPRLSSILQDYYEALTRGDYQSALDAAARLREYLMENYDKLDPELVEALARLSSINVTGSGIVVDVDKYSSILSSIIDSLNNTGSAITVGSGEPGALGGNGGEKGFIEQLVKAIQEHALRDLGKKAAEIIRLHGGESLVKLLSQLSAKNPLESLEKSGGGLGGIAGILGPGSTVFPPVSAPLPLLVPQAPSSGSPISPALYLVALLGSFAAVMVIVWAYRRRVFSGLLVALEERRLRSLIGAHVAGGTRGEVVYMFSRLLQVYSRLFARRAASETHREYAVRLPRELRGVYMDAARAYEEAKFSSHPVSESHLERVRRALKEAFRIVHRS